ncbi:MAG: DUF3817 domain-containing protein [Myxococcota bacterium]
MEYYLVWRLIKLLAVALFAGGTLGSVLSSTRTARLNALGITTVGLVLTWIAGFAMMKMTSRGLSELWIVWALVSSFLGFHGVALVAHKPQPRQVSSVLAVGGMLSAVAVMVWRGAEVMPLVALSVIAVAVSVLLVWHISPKVRSAQERDVDMSWAWFRWVARLEGLSVIVLMLVFLPLKHGAGVVLDGGTGLLGWTHGVLVVVYLQALMSTGRMLGWSGKRYAAGFGMSLVPFGTFVFERWVEPTQTTT